MVKPNEQVSQGKRCRHIAISIADGRTVRDLFYNGLLDRLCERGYSITVFTEAIRVPGFMQEWQRLGVEFADLLPFDVTVNGSRAFWMRRRIVKLHSRSLLQAWLRWEEGRFFPSNLAYCDLFLQRRPDLLIATHAHLVREAELIATAHKLGIPTLGIVRSWDNVYKGIRSRPQRLAVWNEINRQEVIELEGYDAERVDIVGAPQFDPYFALDTVWSREKLAAQFHLDPSRPIILFASLGYFIPGFDETCWMDVLLQLLQQHALFNNPQIICRLHPWSRLEHFQRYANHPDVRLSYVDRYWPSLTWYMTREDVVLMANMLRHADTVITPGSTVTLEAAIFDRPTLVPVFHLYQPDQARNYFNTWVMGKHFGRIEKLDLVPVIRQIEDFGPAINRCLQQPAWYHAQRHQLVDDYVHFTDGNSVERLVNLVTHLVDEQRA